MLCPRVPLFSSLESPLRGFRHIFGNAPAIGIAGPQIKLRLINSLIGGFAEQFRGFRHIFGNAPAVEVAEAQIILRYSIAEFCFGLEGYYLPRRYLFGGKPRRDHAESHENGNCDAQDFFRVHFVFLFLCFHLS